MKFNTTGHPTDNTPKPWPRAIGEITKYNLQQLADLEAQLAQAKTSWQQYEFSGRIGLIKALPDINWDYTDWQYESYDAYNDKHKIYVEIKNRHCNDFKHGSCIFEQKKYNKLQPLAIKNGYKMLYMCHFENHQSLIWTIPPTYTQKDFHPDPTQPKTSCGDNTRVTKQVINITNRESFQIPNPNYTVINYSKNRR